MFSSPGPFDCVGLRFANANSAQDDSLWIASPAKSISAPHFSAISCQRGFFDSINAIFFARLQPFNCFSRPNGFVDIVEALVIHQPVAMILVTKTFRFAALVLQCASENAVSYPNVKRSRTATHDVDEILVISHRHSTRHRRFNRVILSEARHWRSQWLAQSKDPTPARASTDSAGSSPPCPRQHRKNALTLPQRHKRYPGPSTALSLASRTPTPLRMTVRDCARQGWMSRRRRDFHDSSRRGAGLPHPARS
jgi:hypothetical protein